MFACLPVLSGDNVGGRVGWTILAVAAPRSVKPHGARRGGPGFTQRADPIRCLGLDSVGGGGIGLYVCRLE